MNEMLNIPLKATYRIINGKPVLINAEYQEISADVVAQFLIEKFGMRAICGKFSAQEAAT